MRLTDLEPRWFAEVGRQGQGVTFLCPHCRGCRLAVTFKNPTDLGAPHPLNKYGVLGESLAPNHSLDERKNIVPPGYLWEREGETFETLTLRPSVDASPAGHWHGFVTDGGVA